MSDNLDAAPLTPVGEHKQRAKRTPKRIPKKKNHSRTAILLAVSIILAGCNLLLLVKLGLPVR